MTQKYHGWHNFEGTGSSNRFILLSLICNGVGTKKCHDGHLWVFVFFIVFSHQPPAYSNWFFFFFNNFLNALPEIQKKSSWPLWHCQTRAWSKGQCIPFSWHCWAHSLKSSGDVDNTVPSIAMPGLQLGVLCTVWNWGRKLSDVTIVKNPPPYNVCNH